MGTRTAATGVLAVVLALGLVPELSGAALASDDPRAAALSSDLEEVRLALGIPGMAAAVVEDGEIIWAEGFGLADVDDGVAAAPDTPFGLASVTKPIAATLLMQLVEEGLVDLDRPASDYGADLDSTVTARHLLTHTSEGTPGAIHDYNGNRYALLGDVMAGSTGQSFSELLTGRILEPVGMVDSALNPLSGLDGDPSGGFGDFARSFGWGEAYRRYPDVYRRLAHPYQFGENFEIIPGMYQLVHSPAAGMMSSVLDLARFDIALDSGLLLKPATREQMLSPQVATISGRTDLHYGLGWYVQEFEGVQLIWHTGRWPPSTSALYLKAPEHNLTFVILANTDNLTVPFPGIGFGDLSRSLPMLVFFRQFLFPLQSSVELPDVDWFETSQGELVAELRAHQDERVMRLVERELWSTRQAMASSGQTERAELLRLAAVTAFAGSDLQADPNTTSLSGRSVIAAPVPAARTFSTISMATAVWLGAVFLSLAVMAVLLWRRRPGSRLEWFVWPVAALFLGPVALLLFRLDERRPGAPLATAGCVAGYGAAWVVTILMLRSATDATSPLVVLGSILLVPVAVHLVLVRAPTMRRGAGMSFGRAIRSVLVVEWITAPVAIGAMFLMTMFFQERLLTTIPPVSSPFFWGMVSAALLSSVVLLVPLHRIMIGRGFTVWPGGEDAVRLPKVRDAWSLLLASFGLLATAFVLAVGLSS